MRESERELRACKWQRERERESSHGSQREIDSAEESACCALKLNRIGIEMVNGNGTGDGG